MYDIKDDYLKTIFENPEYEDRVVALHTFTENNVWINYFQKVYKKHLANKENWIDFESEISSMIQTMDGLIKYYEEHPEEVDKILIEGTEKARKTAKQTMEKIKQAMKLDYFEE